MTTTHDDDQRDYDEEAYNRDLCPACGVSPCQWDGVTDDGFHTDTEWDETLPPRGAG